MALLHEKSAECVLSELDLFSCPLTQMSVEGSQYVEISPISSITDRGPIEFYIVAKGEKYLDLNNTILYLRLKITNADGTDLAADTEGAMDLHVILNGPNRGLTQRARFSAESKEFQVLGPLHADIFFCERLLLNSLDIRIKLTRGSDAFCLMHAANREYRLHVFYVKKVTVAPAVHIGHSAALIKSNALYPLSRINLKTFSIPANSRICTQENLFLGTLPNYIVLGLANHEAFTGSSNLNPFNFIHCDLEYLVICQDGRQIPAKPFQPQFENNQCVREYYNLFSSTGRHLKDQPLFPLPQTTTLIVYASYNSILKIDSKRNILTDYY
ncbi:hypothetical protein Q5P01_000404 [Channa striata]|uniref:Uncharacterized protein n=1 Tax=Channa striata TaxID=64152 RepID=A0AA88IC37_CHASR|nr:hypothetical protein Q5P01_000404 [Channa striata]